MEKTERNNFILNMLAYIIMFLTIAFLIIMLFDYISQYDNSDCHEEKQFNEFIIEYTLYLSDKYNFSTVDEVEMFTAQKIDEKMNGSSLSKYWNNPDDK